MKTFVLRASFRLLWIGVLTVGFWTVQTLHHTYSRTMFDPQRIGGAFANSLEQPRDERRSSLIASMPRMTVPNILIQPGPPALPTPPPSTPAWANRVPLGFPHDEGALVWRLAPFEEKQGHCVETQTVGILPKWTAGNSESLALILDYPAARRLRSDSAAEKSALSQADKALDRDTHAILLDRPGAHDRYLLAIHPLTGGSKDSAAFVLTAEMAKSWPKGVALTDSDFIALGTQTGLLRGSTLSSWQDIRAKPLVTTGSASKTLKLPGLAALLHESPVGRPAARPRFAPPVGVPEQRVSGGSR